MHEPNPIPPLRIRLAFLVLAALLALGVAAPASAFHDIVCFNGCNTDDDSDGWTEAQGDCLDSSDSNAPFIHPGATDSCGSPGPVDNNCNRCTGDGCIRSEPPFDVIDCDGDADGVFASEGDCDDQEATIYPGAEEICDNEIDDNCDAVVDGDDTETCGGGVDADGDGYTVGEGDCNDADDTVHPGVEFESCDFVDENCDDIGDDAVFGLGSACTTGGVAGTFTCSEGGGGVICFAEGAQIYATGGDVSVHLFGPAGSLFDADIYLFSPGPPRLLGTNRDNSIVELGSFPDGTELLFGLVVHNTVDDAEDQFVLGPACRNFDGGVHARLAELGGTEGTGWVVEFEDVRAPAAPVFDDMEIGVFGVSAANPAVVPESCNGRDDDCDGEIDEDGCVARDFAVVGVTPPGSATIKNGEPETKPISVQVQNRGVESETFADADALANLVQLEISPLQAECSESPVATLIPPKKLPVTVKSKGKLTLKYDVTFAAACDPAKSTKNADHDDFRYEATASIGAFGGSDVHPADDTCPRAELGTDPNPDGKVKDKGCPEERTDVIVK